MALDFPASPNINDTYTFGGVTWTWDGTTWKVLGRFQFTSSETDPVFSASPAFSILNQNITNWNDAYGWGDHSTAGYLSSLGSIGGHSDVTIATLSDAQILRYSVANARWENWTPNYLTSYTETDPVFTASPAGGITGTNIANWNTSYGWGDHGAAGYLTAEADTLDTVLTRGATTTQDITTTGKVYFSNNFATTGDLPNATTYHGMFAHVHAEGHGYFAHAGAWTQLLDTGSSLSDLADVSSTAPSTNDVLAWDGSNWAPSASAGGGGGANVTISDTAPGSASAGDLWWESDKGRLKIYYNDTDSTQWVDASPPLADATSIGGQGTVAMLASLIPDTNDAYDLGNAEYKIRDIYEANPSDVRLKTDVVDYTGGLKFVESLRVVDFTWKEDVDVKSGKRETGLIAQEVKEALDASNYNSWRLHIDGDTQGVDKKQLIPALISAIQELSARVKELENK
jgi:hypothetical protein